MKSNNKIEVTERPQQYRSVVENRINHTIIEKPSATGFIEKISKFFRK